MHGKHRQIDKIDELILIISKNVSKKIPAIFLQNLTGFSKPDNLV